MAKLKIEGVPPHDGEYDLDLAALKGSELHLIKQISGVRAGELQEALEAGDYDLVVAFTVMVIRRAGREVEPAAIMDADVGSITIDLETEDVAEEDERPLASSPTPSGSESSSDVGSSSNGGTETSGPSSSDIGVEPLSLPRAIGSRG